MRKLIALCIVLATVVPAAADEASTGFMIEDFTLPPEARWQFFTDQVMGGVSSGQVTFVADPDQPYARMTGRVSTANRGGFIQMRLDLPSHPPEGVTGIRLLVRGNDQRYYSHLRTSGTVLPWQYYQAAFDVTQDWSEVRLPFTDFVPSGILMRGVLRTSTLRSVAVVAYGRDHEAQIDVREVGFY